MKIRFIVPKDQDQEAPSAPFFGARVFPPSGLARMAGLAGAYGRVSLFDERMGSKLESCVLPADIVIIFANGYNRLRAYELAGQYRAQSTYVVFTGPLMNQWPEEACEYADCLFIGDGEEIMPTFLRDYRQGVNRRLYGGTSLVGQSPKFFMGRSGTAFGLAS